MNRIFSGGGQGGGIDGNNDLGMQQRQPSFDAGGGFGMGNSRGGYNGQDLLRQSSGQSSNSVAQQTANMDPNDRYGLMGLLNVIRMTDPNLTTLALGPDLTMLGLNLNSSEPLYTNFSPPWLTDATPKHELGCSFRRVIISTRQVEHTLQCFQSFSTRLCSIYFTPCLVRRLNCTLRMN